MSNYAARPAENTCVASNQGTVSLLSCPFTTQLQIDQHCSNPLLHVSSAKLDVNKPCSSTFEVGLVCMLGAPLLNRVCSAACLPQTACSSLHLPFQKANAQCLEREEASALASCIMWG